MPIHALTTYLETGPLLAEEVTSSPPKTPDILADSQFAKLLDICFTFRDREELANDSFSGCIRDPNTAGSRESRFILKSTANGPSTATRSLSLKHLVGGQQQTSNGLPTITTKHRYGIATALCWSVLHMGGSYWLGERLDTERAVILSAKHSHSASELLSHYPSVACRLSAPSSRKQQGAGSLPQGSRTEHASLSTASGFC